MIIAIYVVAVLAVLVSGIALYGLTLPVGHVAACCIELRRSPTEVWAAISDFERQPTWRSGLRGVTRGADRDGRPVWVEERGRERMSLRIDEMQPPTRLVTRIIGDGLPFGGTWTFTITPHGEAGAALQITEQGEIYNPVFRAVARLALGYHFTIEQYMRDLAKHLGEQGAIRRV